MSNKAVFLTPEGRRKIEEELEYLRTVKRTEVANRIRLAKEEGDIMENAEYDDAKSEQAFLEGRILMLERTLNSAVAINEDAPADKVHVGCTVTVAEDGFKPETYHIVGSAEADPARGRISNESPIGRALLGHKTGETVDAHTPGGTLRLRIVSIQ
jgi:transcription elongation factor GreA